MLEKISPRAGRELGTSRYVGQRLTHCANGAPSLQYQEGIIKQK